MVDFFYYYVRLTKYYTDLNKIKYPKKGVLI